MTLEHLRPGESPSWAGVLPGKPEPFFLEAGDGERSQMFDALVTVLVTADETNGQFGMFTVEQPAGQTIVAHTHQTHHEVFYIVEGAVRVFLEHPDGQQEDKLLKPGDFGYVPAGVLHAYRAEAVYNKCVGVSTGGFERFFQALGTLTDVRGGPGEFFMPSPQQMGEAFGRYGNVPKLDQQWREA
jgi:quercetin 2,3-dioxygenase